MRRAGWHRNLAVLIAAAFIAVTATAYGGGRRAAEAAIPDGIFASGSAAQDGAQFGGVVNDADGVPLANVAVAMCGSACWPTWTDQSGRFFFPSLPAGRYALDVRGESVAGRTLTSVVLPVTLAPGSREFAAAVQLHEMQSVAGWQGTAPVRFAGLSLAPAGPVDVAALARATDADSVAAGTIGGAQVPREAWPDYHLAADDVRYRPLAMWALHPFGVRVGGPLTVRVVRPSDTRGREADLAFFSVDLVTGVAQWLGPALAEQNDLSTGPAHGITTLTWIILAERVS